MKIKTILRYSINNKKTNIYDEDTVCFSILLSGGAQGERHRVPLDRGWTRGARGLWVPNYPDVVFHKGYGWFKRHHEVINGVKVTRLPMVVLRLFFLSPLLKKV